VGAFVWDRAYGPRVTSVIVYADLFDLSQHVSADSGLKTALEQNMHATQRLVTSFLRSRPALGHDATYQRCQKVQTEVCVRSSRLRIMST
jgi:E3 ubiquitin-protein ligase BRE1